VVSNPQGRQAFSKHPMTGDKQEADGSDFHQLEARLGYSFSNQTLLQLALTHSSAAASSGSGCRSNERLEFLGDRVLGLVIASMLFKSFSDENEGALARRHAALVGRASLASVAKLLGIGDHMRMSRGEIDAGGTHNPALLSNACEAIIAAIYLDAGMEAADRFVQRYWRPIIEGQEAPPTDAKTELQEWAQGKGLPLPQYREISRRGPSHAPTFVIEVSVQSKIPVTAVGLSKRASEKAAAEAMLVQIRADND